MPGSEIGLQQTAGVGVLSAYDGSALARAADLWGHWGFESWSLRGMSGVRRRVTFTKGGLIGEVARYYADDYIVWRHGGEDDWRWVFETWAPAREVMLHRFVFVTGAVVRGFRKRSFFLGLKGYLEVHQYCVGAGVPRRLEDLAALIEEGWRMVQTRGEER